MFHQLIGHFANGKRIKRHWLFWFLWELPGITGNYRELPVMALFRGGDPPSWPHLIQVAGNSPEENAIEMRELLKGGFRSPESWWNFPAMWGWSIWVWIKIQWVHKLDGGSLQQLTNCVDWYRMFHYTFDSTWILLRKPNEDWPHWPRLICWPARERPRETSQEMNKHLILAHSNRETAWFLSHVNRRCPESLVTTCYRLIASNLCKLQCCFHGMHVIRALWDWNMETEEPFALDASSILRQTWKPSLLSMSFLNVCLCVCVCLLAFCWRR